MWPGRLAHTQIVTGSVVHFRILKADGFSMLEIMLVTALMAVLVSLAAPAYQSLALRSYRTEAIAALMRAAACQERIRVASGRYRPGECQIPATDRYRYAIASENEPAGLDFVITASPLGRQAKDRCGAISLDHNGYRNIGNDEADPVLCWSGR